MTVEKRRQKGKKDKKRDKVPCGGEALGKKFAKL